MALVLSQAGRGSPLTLAAAGNVDADDLSLTYCFKDLTSVARLTHLSRLTSLNVSFNTLPQLKGIQSLTSLQCLNAAHNNLSVLEDLAALQGLTQLLLNNNRISSTDALVQLPGLQLLALHSNSISAAACVLALTHLTGLRHLTLCKNPVCKQDNWQQATIATLPSLQALDDAVISTQQRATASAYADVWTAAGQREYSCNSTPRDTTGCDSMPTGADAHARSVAPPGGTGSTRAGSRGSSAAGRLRPRVPSTAGQADSMSIKDATSMLPSMSLQPLKPSSLVRRPVELTASKYGYSRAKPLKVLQKQVYTASGGSAVLIHSDGSASLAWPEGSLAVTLDMEETAAASSSRPGSSTPPIKGYRMLAMYRSITGVAASFDSSGGFVQWPNGQLMLVWDGKDGKAYAPDGAVTHSFTNKRATTTEVTARLDEHFSIRFAAGELQLSFACEGCEAVLSQRHGPVLPDRHVTSLQHQSATPTLLGGPGHLAASHEQQDQPAQCLAEGDSAGGSDMQALLARARALMSAGSDDAPVGAEASGMHPPVLPVSGSSTVQQDDTNTPDDEDDLQAMMARARAAVAAVSVAEL